MFSLVFVILCLFDHLIKCVVLRHDMTCVDIICFNVYSLLVIFVLACAGSALWCNDLCGMCFMLSIAISHVTR